MLIEFLLNEIGFDGQHEYTTRFISSFESLFNKASQELRLMEERLKGAKRFKKDPSPIMHQDAMAGVARFLISRLRSGISLADLDVGLQTALELVTGGRYHFIRLIFVSSRFLISH